MRVFEILEELVKLSRVRGRDVTSQDSGEGFVAYGGECEWRGVRTRGAAEVCAGAELAG